MPKKKLPDNKFTISLKENGLHSLWRGIDSYGAYDKSYDKLMLKDAIMFLHHGVELLMKEILIKHSQFLIFEELKDIAAKQKQANNLGVGIFFLDKPPKTVTYDEAIKRVSAFIQPPELTDDLQKDLVELNKVRNQLEHYAIETDKEQLTKLLASLHEPLLTLFENQIGNVRKIQPESVNLVWKDLDKTAKFYSMAKREIFELVHFFKGQKVPGALFCVDGEFTLPEFDAIYANRILARDGMQFTFDIFCESKKFGNWVIEVKGGHTVKLASIIKIAFQNQPINAKVWFVSFGGLTQEMKKFSRQNNVLLTGIDELRELQKILLPPIIE